MRQPPLLVVVGEQQVHELGRAGTEARSAASSLSTRSASTSWARTRSRSSWLAARPNVTTSICSSRATPSTTYLVTSAPIVHVLPVPALASSSTVPVGSGSVMAKGLGSVTVAHSGPTFSTPDSSGSQTCQAYVGRPASRSDSTVARGPKTLTW